MINKIVFPIFLEEVIEVIRIAAKQTDCKASAIVGGVIRDAILSKMEKNQPDVFFDVDVVVEGSAYNVAKRIEKILGTNRVTIIRNNKAYQTVELRIDQHKIDIASARIETYFQPGENPIITVDKINKDLGRRDFSINAIAFDLNKRLLIDLHKGILSLKNRELEFLHSKSISEDPTRIVRGARYAARLKFKLSKKALSQVNSTINDWPWRCDLKSPNTNALPALSTRLRMEMELLLQEKSFIKAISLLKDWKALRLFDQSLQDDSRLIRRVHWASKLNINLFIAFVAGSSNPLEISDRLQLPANQRKILADSLVLRKKLYKIYTSQTYLSWPTSRWCEEIEKYNFHQDSIAINICLGVPLWRTLFKWFTRWRKIKSSISAKDLMNQGLLPGPALGEELKRQRYKQLDKLN